MTAPKSVKKEMKYQILTFRSFYFSRIFDILQWACHIALTDTYVTFILALTKLNDMHTHIHTYTSNEHTT